MGTPDCIVIGGGVIGLAVADRLARESLRVTLLERGICGGAASWAGAGILAPCNPHRTDVTARLQLESLHQYPAFCSDLLARTGVDPEYEACGELDLLFAEDDRRIAESDAAAGRGRVLADGGPSYVLHDRDATRRLAPAASDQIVGSLECRETAQVRNPRLLRALQIACLQSGVTIREESEVVDFIVRDRRIIGVELSQERVHGGSVVLCAGAWSSRIGKRLAGILPVHPVRGQMILLKAEGPPFRPILSRGKTYLVPRRDGHVLLGSTEEPDAGYEARTTAQGIARLLEKALRLAPGLAALPVAATWAGLRPGTPDERPYVGPVPGYEGLFAAAGHFRAGLTLAPITAEAVACLMLGRAFFADLTPLRPGRTPASPHAK